jgi:hypothetical protein
MAVEPEGNQGSNFGASFSEEQFYPAPPANENELPAGFFLGREEEQARFREMLQSLSGSRRSLLAGLFGSNKKQGRVAGTIQGRVIAVSGVAGAGKTRLSLRLREISQKEKAFSRRFYVTRLDWHEVRERDHRMTPHYGNQAISPDVFLDIIYTHFVREEQGSYFEAYKSAVEETRELARQVSGAELMAVYEYRAKALGKSLLNMSSQRPLLFFLDNYELVADRDDLLRAAMQESGPEVVWIIAGQGELGDYTAERFLQFQLGPLTQAELLQFFKAELSRYQDESKTGAASFYRSPEQIVRLHEITGGLPLAARLATFLLQTGLEVAELPAGSPNPVETLLDEFLNGPLGKGHPDRTKLYALALLRRPERGVLSALLDLRQDLVPLSEVLNLVQSRYAFLFEPVREMVLHPAIEQPMRTWMLQPAQRQDEQGISRLNRRAMGFLTEQINRWGENFPS